MPSLGADMESGTLVEWQMAPGDHVRRGQVVAVVETDKGAIDVEVWHDGVVERLLVPPGTRVPVGTLLATFRAAAAPAPVPAPVPPAPAAVPALPQVARTAAEPHRRASPAARRLARERGIDLATITGSGPSGAVVLADVEARAPEAAAPAAAPAPAAPAAPAAAPAPAAPAAPLPTPAPPPPAGPAEAMRRVIAAAMARSKREIPHYYLSTELDVSAPLRALEAYNRERPPAERVLPVAVLLRAVALALVEFPELRGHYLDDRFQPGPVHLGVAIALRGGGLVAPAIHDADRRSVPELMQALADVTARARSGHLRASELGDATVTVTSLGDRGVDAVFGVIHPPQVAIVGLGRVRERPWAESGLLGVRPQVTATLAADHRVSDGHRGGRFLARVGELLSREVLP